MNAKEWADYLRQRYDYCRSVTLLPSQCRELAVAIDALQRSRDELLKACSESLVVMTMNGSTLVDPSRAIRMASAAIEKAREV